MKQLSFLLSLLMLLSCKSKALVEKPIENKSSKIALSNIDENKKHKVYELGKRILMICNTSKFKPFNATEATPTVISNMTPDRLTKTCLKFRLKYGNFKDIQLIETYRNENDTTIVFRYKALYEKKIANKELRMFLNNQDQISSVKTLDWQDYFNYEYK